MAQRQNKTPSNPLTEKRLKKPAAVCLLSVMCCALWGSAFPFIKIGYGLFAISSEDTASQILFAGIRFTLAGILVVFFGSLISKRVLLPGRNSISHICLLSLFQTVLQYTFFYIGLANTTAAKSSVINSTGTFFAVITACLVMKQERLKVQKIAGCALGFAGTVIINLSNGSVDGGISFSGEGMILLSSVSYAVSSVLIKRFSQKENTVVLSGYQFAAGGAVMVVYGLIFGGRLGISIGIKNILLLLYLAFLSAAAYTLWGILLKYNDVSRVAVFGFMTPVFGCAFSALLLGESFLGNGLKAAAALLFVCAGIITVNYNKNIKGDKYDG